MRFLVILPFISCVYAGDTPVPVASRLDAVTVYLDRAVMSRVARVELPAGHHQVVLVGLPSEMVVDELRVVGDGVVRPTAMVSRLRVEPAKPAEEQRQAEAALLAMEAQRRELDDRRADSLKAQTYIDEVAKSPFIINKERSLPTTEQYKDILGYVRQQRLTIAEELRSIDQAIASMEPRLVIMRQQVAQLRQAPANTTRDVVIDVESHGGQGTLTVSYQVLGSTWYPVYEARMDSQRRQMRLTASAMVQQASGEDWAQVAVTLSAMRPSDRVRPQVDGPRRLSIRADGASKSDEYQVDMANRLGSNSWSPHYNLQKMQGNRANEFLNAAQTQVNCNMNYVEDMVRVMEQRATTAVFAVPGRAVVPTTGVGVRLTIGQWEMPLATTLEVYPAQSANAQIMGAVTNPATAPWLPGPVRIAVGEELIGATTLAFTAPHETTSLWLGIDDSIRVTRTLEERTRAAGTRTLELSMKWNTQLLSTSAQEKSLTVIEPLPLSEDERIEVELDRPEPRTPIQQGVARWELVLPPRGKQNLSVGWTITAPLGSKIAGLEPAELTRIR